MYIFQCPTRAEVWAWTHYQQANKKEKMADGLEVDRDSDVKDDDVPSSFIMGGDDKSTETTSISVPVVSIHRVGIPQIVVDRNSSTPHSDSEQEGSLVQKGIKRKKNKSNKVAKKSCSMLDIPASLAANNPLSLTDSDSSDELDVEVSCECSEHNGKETLNAVFPVSVDQMFLLLFTDSEFFKRLHKGRNTTGE